MPNLQCHNEECVSRLPEEDARYEVPNFHITITVYKDRTVGGDLDTEAPEFFTCCHCDADAEAAPD
jgi:hypothetical protein